MKKLITFITFLFILCSCEDKINNNIDEPITNFDISGTRGDQIVGEPLFAGDNCGPGGCDTADSYGQTIFTFTDKPSVLYGTQDTGLEARLNSDSLPPKHKTTIFVYNYEYPNITIKQNQYQSSGLIGTINKTNDTMFLKKGFVDYAGKIRK